MSANPSEVDLDALGLLDGLEGPERTAREQLLTGLLARGVTVRELQAAVAEDRLVLLAVERVLGGAYTVAEVAQRSGVAAEQLRRTWRALGFPEVEDGERAFNDQDVAAAKSLRAFLDAGISEESLLEMAWVLGEGMSRLSSAMTGTFVNTFLRPGDTELDVSERFVVMARQLLPLMSPVLDATLAGHVRQATRRGIIGRAERERGHLSTAEKVVICFADLVGFTSLGGEVDVEELGLVARSLGELATEIASPTVRLVKTIGDAAMFVSTDASATVATAIALVEAVSEAGLPALRAGVARGTALTQAGDWYGQAVNLASRVTGVARPHSVLCTEDVHDAALDQFSWSSAGRFRLKGLSRALPLYRARALGEGDQPRRRRGGRSRTRASS